MSEKNTHNLNGRSFEERVMARFDAMDERLNAIEDRFDSRFDSVESRLERLEARDFDTKPIWERAVAEISEVKDQVQVLTSDMVVVKERLQLIDYKFDVLIQDVMDVRTQQRYLKARVDHLESS